MFDPVRLRGHHLLCILPYVGKGYTQAFVDHFDALVGRLNAGEEIVIVEGPDDICASMHDKNGPTCESGEHCLKPRAAQRDRTALTAVATALDCSLETRSTLHLTPDQYTHLRRLFTEGALREACQGCEWHAFCTTVAAQDFAATKLMPQK